MFSLRSTSRKGSSTNFVLCTVECNNVSIERFFQVFLEHVMSDFCVPIWVIDKLDIVQLGITHNPLQIFQKNYHRMKQRTVK